MLEYDQTNQNDEVLLLNDLRFLSCVQYDFLPNEFKVFQNEFQVDGPFTALLDVVLVYFLSFKVTEFLPPQLQSLRLVLDHHLHPLHSHGNSKLIQCSLKTYLLSHSRSY